MATLLQIHADQVRHNFENTPQLLPPDRQKLFDLPAGFKRVVSQLRTEVNQLGFLMQLDYFQATHRFFPIDKFRQEDANYIIIGLDYNLSLELQHNIGH